MWFRSQFGSLKSRGSRPPRRRQEPRSGGRRPAARLRLEALEDRWLLSFSPAVNYPVGSGPQAVVVADFNNDARLDLAVADAASNTVSVLLGNANGTFQPALSSATGAGPVSLVAGDFNADGKMDLATANNASSDVSVLLGVGDGTFQPPASAGLGGAAPASVAVGDFNADGKLDLGVLGNVYTPAYWGRYSYYPGYYNGYAVVLLGTGSGTFSGPNWYYVGGGFQTSAAVADFNGDLKLDFAATSDYSVINVALGTGTGGFNFSNSYSAGAYPSSLTASDVNKDGKADLVAALPSADSVSVLLGDGLGSFSNDQLYAAGSQPGAVATADFNGDGNIDLITTNADTNTVSALLGTGTGTFKPPVDAAVGLHPQGVAFGDYSGDGLKDAAAANTSSSDVSVLLNDGSWPAFGAPSLAINDVTVTEGNTGTTSATFSVSLSAASTQTVTVHYATADGTATTAGGDYQATSGTLTFAPGVTSQSATVLVNGDHLVEGTESFLLVLTNPTNAFVADAKGVGTILDDEPHASIDFGPVSVTEGNTGTTTAVFTVRLSTASDAPVDVNYSTAEGDTEWWNDGWYYYGPPPAATSGSDFAGVSSTLTFAPGETVKTIPITVYGDRIGEYDEYFSLDLTGSTTASIDSHHAVGVIVDDEPRVSIGNASVTEGNTGTTAMTFTVTLSAAYDQPVTVTYATSDGSATTAGGDYQAKSDTVTFAAGQTSQTITVLVNGDRLAESNEFFYVNLTGANGLLIVSSTGNGTILDDEPRLTINSVSINEGDKGTKPMTFTVTLSAAYDQPVTVKYGTHDDSATVADNDYVATPGTLTFAPGETSKTITVLIKGDRKKEANEDFYILLSDASSNALIDSAYGWGTILNDDGPKGRGGGPRTASSLSIWGGVLDDGPKRKK
jgi:hypothetical protein